MSRSRDATRRGVSAAVGPDAGAGGGAPGERAGGEQEATRAAEPDLIVHDLVPAARQARAIRRRAACGERRIGDRSGGRVDRASVVVGESRRPRGRAGGGGASSTGGAPRLKRSERTAGTCARRRVVELGAAQRQLVQPRRVVDHDVQAAVDERLGPAPGAPTSAPTSAAQVRRRRCTSSRSSQLRARRSTASSPTARGALRLHEPAMILPPRPAAGQHRTPRL